MLDPTILYIFNFIPRKDLPGLSVLLDYSTVLMIPDPKDTMGSVSVDCSLYRPYNITVYAAWCVEETRAQSAFWCRVTRVVKHLF
jgi:hypothetical protein